MSEALQIAIFNLVTRVGIDAAVAILSGMKNASTIDDAIKALQDAQKVGWKEAKAGTI